MGISELALCHLQIESHIKLGPVERYQKLGITVIPYVGLRFTKMVASLREKARLLLPTRGNNLGI